MSENQFSQTDDEIKQDCEYNINQKNSQEFQRLMNQSKKKHDNYWDINNPIIRIILIILFIIIVLGAGYYFIMWFR